MAKAVIFDIEHLKVADVSMELFLVGCSVCV